MPLNLPVPHDTLDKYAVSQLFRDIIRKAVDGTVVPLFVDPARGRVLIGTVVASGPEILQVTGSAFITGRLKTGTIFTQDLAAAGCVWAGSIVANASIQASGANIAGTVFASGGVNSLTSKTGPVDVAGAAAPSSGQVLTATGANSATWQTPSAGSDTTARLMAMLRKP